VEAAFNCPDGLFVPKDLKGLNPEKLKSSLRLGGVA
jgi:hypothetical protein